MSSIRLFILPPNGADTENGFVVADDMSTASRKLISYYISLHNCGSREKKL